MINRQESGAYGRPDSFSVIEKFSTPLFCSSLSVELPQLVLRDEPELLEKPYDEPGRLESPPSNPLFVTKDG